MTPTLWGVPASHMQDLAGRCMRLAHTIDILLDGTPEPMTPGPEHDVRVGLQALSAQLQALSRLVETSLGR